MSTGEARKEKFPARWQVHGSKKKTKKNHSRTLHGPFQRLRLRLPVVESQPSERELYPVRQCVPVGHGAVGNVVPRAHHPPGDAGGAGGVREAGQAQHSLAQLGDQVEEAEESAGAGEVDAKVGRGGAEVGIKTRLDQVQGDFGT